MFIQYGLQLGPAKPKLTVLMPTLHLLDNTKMDKGLFAIPNNKSRWGNLQWGGGSVKRKKYSRNRNKYKSGFVRATPNLSIYSYTKCTSV